MAKFTLEGMKEGNWELLQEADSKEALEAIVHGGVEGIAHFRILKDGLVTLGFTFSGGNAVETLSLNEPVSGIELYQHFQNSAILKEGGYRIENAYTNYPERGFVQEFEDGERLEETDEAAAIDHDVFFICDNAGTTYVQIYPFDSKAMLSEISYKVISGNSEMVNRDLIAFAEE